MSKDLLLGKLSPQFPNQTGPISFAVGNQGDLQFDKSGKLLMVDNEDKIQQNVGKILLTTQGNGITDPAYGTTLQTFTGSSLSLSSSYALIKQTILDALGYYVNQYQNSTNPNEKIATVESLSVKITDQSSLLIVITVTTAAATTIPISILVG